MPHRGSLVHCLHTLQTNSFLAAQLHIYDAVGAVCSGDVWCSNTQTRSTALSLSARLAMPASAGAHSAVIGGPTVSSSRRQASHGCSPVPRRSARHCTGCRAGCACAGSLAAMGSYACAALSLAQWASLLPVDPCLTAAHIHKPCALSFVLTDGWTCPGGAGEVGRAAGAHAGSNPGGAAR